MGLSAALLKRSLKSVAAKDRRVAAALDQVGFPETRAASAGFESLLRIIVGQQLSVKAAATIHGRVIARLNGEVTPGSLLRKRATTLRAAGLSQQKVGYVRDLALATKDGRLDFLKLSKLDDAEAMATICSVKGLGPWSAEIYLLFCEGRRDIWPSGDLALQTSLMRLMKLKTRPTAKQTLPLVEGWRPHRGAMAVFLWHYYAKSEAPV